MLSLSIHSTVTECKRSFSSHVNQYLNYSLTVFLGQRGVLYDSLLAGSVHIIYCSYCAFYFQRVEPPQFLKMIRHVKMNFLLFFFFSWKQQSLTGLDLSLYKETGMTLSLQNFYFWESFNNRLNVVSWPSTAWGVVEFVIPNKHKRTEWEIRRWNCCTG